MKIKRAYRDFDNYFECLSSPEASRLENELYGMVCKRKHSERELMSKYEELKTHVMDADETSLDMAYLTS
jgi:hypothetical protein